MAILIYGKKLSEDELTVRYLVARDIDDPEPAVLAIDVSDRANWTLGKPARFSCCHAMTWTPPGSKGLPAPPWTVVR